MQKHHRIYADHIVHQTISRFIEVWPDATIHDLAKAMPTILHEAHLYANADVPARQLARNCVVLLWNNQLMPPWVDGYADDPPQTVMAL